MQEINFHSGIGNHPNEYAQKKAIATMMLIIEQDHISLTLDFFKDLSCSSLISIFLKIITFLQNMPDCNKTDRLIT